MKKIDILKASIIISVIILAGCKSLNSQFGCDSADYTHAKELPPLKLPANSLSVSKRYDIPTLPNNNNPLISDNVPPDYCQG